MIKIRARFRKVDFKLINDKFLYQKIKQCFLDYNHDLDHMPLTDIDYKKIVQRIENLLNENNESDLYVVIHDVVYDYLTVN
jgi:cytochrome b involved in lipid metabolism